MTQTQRGPVSVERLAWLSGDWAGTLGEQRVEEFWSEPHLGCIENKVRLSNPDDVALIELMMVREAVTDAGEPTLSLRLRQFDGTLAPVADQAMLLDELTDTFAAFKLNGEGHIERLSYRESAPGQMEIQVSLKAGPVVTANVTRR
jgi:hypothetical protein